jgi:excisionase family DNA binding protein
MNANALAPGDLLTVAEVAAFLHCSAATVYRFVAEGKLEHFRLGTPTGRIRIPGVAVEAFLQRHISVDVLGEMPQPERVES